MKPMTQCQWHRWRLESYLGLAPRGSAPTGHRHWWRQSRDSRWKGKASGAVTNGSALPLAHCQEDEGSAEGAALMVHFGLTGCLGGKGKQKVLVSTHFWTWSGMTIQPRKGQAEERTIPASEKAVRPEKFLSFKTALSWFMCSQGSSITQQNRNEQSGWLHTEISAWHGSEYTRSSNNYFCWHCWPSNAVCSCHKIRETAPIAQRVSVTHITPSVNRTSSWVLFIRKMGLVRKEALTIETDSQFISTTNLQFHLKSHYFNIHKCE